MIVLHFTATDSYASVWSTFDSNAPNLGEQPGVCSHYVIEQDGTIDELVPPRIRCRHTIGLNHVAIGIEMVQATGRGSHWADQQILARSHQVGAALRLVRWLQGRYGIPTGEVIGHSMANDDPLLQGPRGLGQRPHRLAEARREGVPQAALSSRRLVPVRPVGRPRPRQVIRRLHPRTDLAMLRIPQHWVVGSLLDIRSRPHPA